MHARTVAVALVLVGCAQRRPGGAAADVEARLQAAELARRPDPAVREALGSTDAATSGRAALAAGRIGMVDAIPELSAMLGKENGGTAAWALGRIEGGEEHLVRCIRARCPAAAAAARALGVPAWRGEAMQALVGALDGPSDVAAEAALALGVRARIAGKPLDLEIRNAAVDKLVAAAGHADARVRYGAAYALGRVPRDDRFAAAPAALLALLREAGPELRSVGARAVARQGGSLNDDLAPLLRDADWRVRVAAARALGEVPGGDDALLNRLPDAVREAGGKGLAAAAQAHVVATMLEQIGRAGGAAAASLPEPSALNGATPAATVAMRCAAALARDRSLKVLAHTPKCGAGLEPEWRGRMRAGALAAELATGPEGPAWEAVWGAFGDHDSRVRSAAAQSAGPALAAALIAALKDEDPFVVGSAAASLAKDPAVAARAAAAAGEAVQKLVAAREKGAGDPASDALTALVQLLAAAPKEPRLPQLSLLDGFGPVGSPALHRALAQALGKPPAPPPAPAVPAEAAGAAKGRGTPYKRLRLNTTAGELVVDLRGSPAEAPLTAHALAGLARKKYYDGLSWHRVVPDFVIQGGDPRGDGDGGPGWALPDEHTPLHFRRGTLGIATSGPETGGSQIFLCHASQPHLDGRYTIAGELVSGLDVMDAIHVGDGILSAAAE